MRYNRPERGNRTGPESVGRLYIRGITVVSASKPLKELGFVSRQADIGDALNEHNICCSDEWPGTAIEYRLIASLITVAAVAIPRRSC
jgi:hypothetical protein